MENLEPYINLILAIVNVTTLGLVIRVMYVVSKQRHAVMEERLKLKDDEKSYIEREKNSIEKERDEIRYKMQHLLQDEGLTVSDIVIDQQRTITAHMDKKLQELLNRMEKINEDVSNSDPKSHLSMAEAFYSKQNWEKAAFHFDQALTNGDGDWEIHFSKAISFANMRGDTTSNLKALEGYNGAICFIPKDEEVNFKARLYIYRGAMLKRLNRLREAESDVKLGIRLTDRQYERLDGIYNLACIYAMEGDRQKMLSYVEQLKGQSRFLNGIRFHLKDFFSEFSNDKELLKLIN